MVLAVKTEITTGFVAIYCRVSTEEQAQRGFSIPEQIEQCMQKAKQLSSDPIREYIDDGHTGEFVSRPALNRLFDDIEKGFIHTVVCLSQDRLSRNATTYGVITEFFDKRKVNLQYVVMHREITPEGKLVDQIMSSVAEFHKKKILSDTARGRRGKAKQGKVLRNFDIYGYDYEKETCQLTINEFESKIVYEIWERFCIRDHSLNSIALDLTARGIPTKKGKRVWHRQVIRQILLQDAYTGTFYANKWNTEGMGLNKFREKFDDKAKMELRPRDEWIPIKCPAIVPMEWKIIVLEKFSVNRKNKNTARVGKYLCSRLLRCDICGNTMNGFRSKNWGRTVYVYGCEKNYAGAKNKGCRPVRRIPIEKIDTLVWTKIKEWMNDVELYMHHEEQNINEDSDLIKLKKQKEQELEKIQKGKKRLIRIIANVEGDEDIENELKEKMNEEKKVLTEIEDIKFLLKLNEQIDERISKQEMHRLCIEKYVHTDPDKLPIEEKNEMIRCFIKEIIVPKNIEELIFKTY